MTFLIEAAATHRLSTLRQNLEHRDGAPAPRVPRIDDASRLSTMGVGLSSSIMRSVRTKVWATSSSRPRRRRSAQAWLGTERLGGRLKFYYREAA
jgi:hypothetical protein